MAGAADNPEEKEGPVRALDEDDIALLKTYGLGPYSTKIKAAEKDLKDLSKKVAQLISLGVVRMISSATWIC